MNSDRNGTSQHPMAAEGRAQGLQIGWTVFSYLIGGMIAYGAIGWLIGRAVHVGLLFPAGMLAGLAISIGYIIYRYGTQAGQDSAHGRGTAPPGRAASPLGRTAGPEGDDR